ncbi:MAG: hypothetical protein IMY85_11415 [Chloroflexi bacterium]|nr:hypothetical protein [Chloroflexota bacterium]
MENEPEKRAIEIDITIRRRIMPATPVYDLNFIEGLQIDLSHPWINDVIGLFIF